MLKLEGLPLVTIEVSVFNRMRFLKKNLFLLLFHGFRSVNGTTERRSPMRECSNSETSILAGDICLLVSANIVLSTASFLVKLLRFI